MHQKHVYAKKNNESQLAIESTLKTLGIFFIPTLCTVPKSPNIMDVKKAFNALKKKELPWMYEVSKYASEYAIKNLGSSYKNLFNGAGYPKYKSKKRGDYSFCAGNADKTFFKKGKNKRISIPGLARYIARKLDISSPLENDKKHTAKQSLGLVKMCEALRFNGRVILATISLEAGRWFASVTVETESTPYIRNDTQVSGGVDLGAATLAYLSNGEQFEGPKPLWKLENRLKRLQRRFAKTKVITVTLEDGKEIKKDSRMRAKMRLRIQRLYAYIANIRNDYLHKLTVYLVKTFDNLFIEDLNVKAMVKNHNLAKAILDMGFGKFKHQLVYKSKLYASRVFMADRWFPSSKKCSCCGEKQKKMPLNVREWTCETCKTHHHRDGNAANNLNSLMEHVIAADLFETEQLSINGLQKPFWDVKNCLTFRYNGRKYSLKNLTAAA